MNRPWPYLGAMALSAMVGLYAWTQPRRPGSRYVAASAGVWSIWALAAALQTAVQPRELRFAFYVLQSTCALAESPLHLMTVLEYTGQERWLRRRSLWLLALPALLFVLVATALPPTSLVSFETHAGIDVIVGNNWVRRGSFGFVVALQALVAAVLLNCLWRAPAFRIPVLLIAIGRLIPVVAFALLDPRRLTVSPVQVTVLFASISFVMYFVALYNFHFLRVIPVAQDLLIRNMPYALLVLDADNRLVDLNPAAQALPGLPGKLALRQAAPQALGDWWERIEPLIGDTPVVQDVAAHSGPDERIFRVTSLPLRQAGGWRMGQALVLEEVTRARQAQAQQARAQWAQATLQERELLAEELHDGLDQTLGFLNLQAQAAHAYLQSGQVDAVQTSLNRLGQVALQMQGDTREMIANLLTISLPSEGLCSNLRQFVARFEQQNRLHVHLDIDECNCDPAILPPATGVQLLRIVQQALANVRQYAGSPTLIEVRLSTRDGQVQLTITDNGAGFDPAATAGNSPHLGLEVMRQRATTIGGALAIRSAPGQGTRVEVRVPLGG